MKTLKTFLICLFPFLVFGQTETLIKYDKVKAVYFTIPTPKDTVYFKEYKFIGEKYFIMPIDKKRKPFSVDKIKVIYNETK